MGWNHRRSHVCLSIHRRIHQLPLPNAQRTIPRSLHANPHLLRFNGLCLGNRSLFTRPVGKSILHNARRRLRRAWKSSTPCQQHWTPYHSLRITCCLPCYRTQLQTRSLAWRRSTLDRKLGMKTLKHQRKRRAHFDCTQSQCFYGFPHLSSQFLSAVNRQPALRWTEKFCDSQQSTFILVIYCTF